MKENLTQKIERYKQRLRQRKELIERNQIFWLYWLLFQCVLIGAGFVVDTFYHVMWGYKLGLQISAFATFFVATLLGVLKLNADRLYNILLEELGLESDGETDNESDI